MDKQNFHPVIQFLIESTVCIIVAFPIWGLIEVADPLTDVPYLYVATPFALIVMIGVHILKISKRSNT